MAGGLRHPADKKLRAMEVVKRHIVQGEQIKDIAKDMNVSQDTIQRSLEWARRANLFVQYEQKLFDELLPLAHEAVKLALQDGDAQVALKILEGTNVLKKNAPKSAAAEADEEGLYGEILKARAGWTIDVTPGRIAGGDSVPAGDEIEAVFSPIDERAVDGGSALAPGEGPTRGEDSVSAGGGDES